MKNIMIASLLLATTALAARADEPPQWMQQVFADQELQAAWQEYQTVYGDENAALDPKTKHLIALGVAAQIPCDYCTLGHSMGAQEGGATEQELKEAVAVAAQVRKLSTMLNGMQYDMDKFRTEMGAPASN